MEHIKAKTDIIDYISTFIPLKKAGANYQAHCPFHNEKSASFIVSPSKQIYTCFGCGKSGDILSFAQEYKQLSFKEALQDVCEHFNIEPPHTQDKSTYKSKDISSKYDMLFKKALILLRANQKLLTYLQERGLNNDDLEHFTIGLMPQKHEILQIFTPQEALDIGLLKKRTTGESYTPFKERIIFAIRNNAFKITGLSGRTHPYVNFRNAPKYINTPTSFIFKKSENLYLFPYAKSTIKTTNKAIIVEGYMDAIALHKLGYKNAIATCGTAFNSTHIAQIARLDENISFTLCFDNDSAGAKASISALDMLFKHKIYDNDIMLLRDVKDVGEILQKELNLAQYASYIPALKYYIHYHFKNAKSPKDKDNLLKHLQSLIDSENNFYAKEHLITQIATFTHIPKDYFYKKNIAIKAKSDSQNRLLKLLHAIYTNDDFAFITKHTLDLDTIPQELRDDLKHFLQTNTLTPNATQIALNTHLYTNFNQNTFYREIIALHLQSAKDKLLSARLHKDIKQILALNAYIQNLNNEIKKSDTEMF